MLLASKGIWVSKSESLTGAWALLGLLFSSRGQKKEPWKNPLIKIRLETEQRITEGESQSERGEKEKKLIKQQK